MSIDRIKRKFWDAVRPLHLPLTKAIRKRLGRNYAEHPEMELPLPYEAVQLEVERRLHCYLHVSPEQIGQIVIVGANEGEEIRRLRKTYPCSRFLCFEPSPKWFNKLGKSFRDADFVTAHELALSDSAGTATFYELPLAGNGSLLRPDPARWSAFNKIDHNQVTSFQVRVSTLDEEIASLDRIDLLWIDVQGAEGNVLRGAPRALARTSAVFLEVALIESPYQGALLFSELDSLLNKLGFDCVSLGLDVWNYSGNALWVKDIARRSPWFSLSESGTGIKTQTNRKAFS